MVSIIGTVVASAVSILVISSLPPVVSADGGYSDVKIVEGIDKVSGTGHDMTLAYSFPDPFQGYIKTFMN